MSIPASISHSVQQTQEWLKALCDAGSYASETEALAVLRAVLHQLRDRLTQQEAVDLAAQLPIVVRGIYYEGWQPLRTPQKLRTQEEFLDGVRAKLAPHPIGPENATRDVFSLLAQAIDTGEIIDVIDQLRQASRSFGLEVCGVGPTPAPPDAEPAVLGRAKGTC